MTTQNYIFSTFDTKEETVFMENVFRECFDFGNFDAIQKIYHSFESDFCDKTESSEKQKIKFLEKTTIKPKTNEHQIHSYFKENDCFVGIDLPSLIHPKVNRKNKTVLIIAEDALRDMKKDCFKNRVVFSTPFGVHLKEDREGKLNHYWELISSILDKGYSVYLTDAKKLWMRRSSKSSKANYNRALSSGYEHAFKKETEFIKPVLIVTLGNPAKHFAGKQITSFIEKEYFCHLSGAANGAWKKHFPDWDIISQGKKVEYIISKISKYLI